MWVIKTWENEINHSQIHDVGYYDPQGIFCSEFTYDNIQQAQYQCSFLNGGPNHQLREVLEDMAAAIESIEGIHKDMLAAIQGYK